MSSSRRDVSCRTNDHLHVAEGIEHWIMAASATRRHVVRGWLRAGLGAIAAFGFAALVTRGLRERVTSESTTSAVVHADRSFIPLLRAEADLPVAGPVLLCEDGGYMQLPAAIFYSRKPVQQVWIGQPPDASGRAPRYYDARPLADFAGSQPHLLLIPKDQAGEIPATMKFDELREAGDLEIGTVASR